MTRDAGKLMISEVEIASIYVLNPRDRDQTKFNEIIESIERVGLKRPIKVSTRASDADDRGFSYNLVCGQGRMEAFKALGRTTIPAIIVSLSEEECFLQSLIENIARRRHNPVELMKSIELLLSSNYSHTEIARKTGLSREYVRDIVRLIKDGEQRLIAAVEQNQIPLSIAICISGTSDADAQRALQEAYDRKELRGRKLQTAMRVLKSRERFGPSYKYQTGRKQVSGRSARSMVEAYKRETERQRLLIKRADLTETRLLLISTALKQLLADEHFRTLLRAESLYTIPSQVSALLTKERPVK